MLSTSFPFQPLILFLTIVVTEIIMYEFFQNKNISYPVHLGGAIGGILLTLVIAKNMKINYNPAFTNIIVDTISAGDTYFATSSMVLFLTKSLKLSSFIGNLSGALAVGLLGCKPIDKNLFIDSLNSYLKT